MSHRTLEILWFRFWPLLPIGLFTIGVLSMAVWTIRPSAAPLPCTEGPIFTQHFDDGASYTVTAAGVQSPSHSRHCSIMTYHVRVQYPSGWTLASVERLAEPLTGDRDNLLRREWRVLLQSPAGGLDVLAVRPWQTLVERGTELVCRDCTPPTFEVEAVSWAK